MSLQQKRLVPVHASGTSVMVGVGDSKVGEAGQGDFGESGDHSKRSKMRNIRGYQILKRYFRFDDRSRAVVISSTDKEDINLIQPIDGPRPSFKLPPFQACASLDFCLFRPSLFGIRTLSSPPSTIFSSLC